LAKSRAKQKAERLEAHPPLPEGLKRCGSCKEVLPLEQFMRDKRNSKGRGCYCVPCNRKKSAKRGNAYYHRHAETRRAKQNERRRGPAAKAVAKVWRKRPEVRAVIRERERVTKGILRERRYANGDVETSLEVSFTRADWIAVIEKFGGACAYCGKPGRMTLEHIVPLVSGGRTEKGNIIPACLPCNASKQERPFEEFCRERGVDPDQILNGLPN